MTAKVAYDSFHNITEELNRRSKLAQFAGGQVVAPYESDDDAETGNSKRSCSRQIDGGEEESNRHEPNDFKAMNKEQKGHRHPERNTEDRRQRREELVKQKAERRQMVELTKGNVEHQRA